MSSFRACFLLVSIVLAYSIYLRFIGIGAFCAKLIGVFFFFLGPEEGIIYLILNSYFMYLQLGLVKTYNFSTTMAALPSGWIILYVRGYFKHFWVLHDWAVTTCMYMFYTNI